MEAVTVITPTIAERAQLLEEARASVLAQDLPAPVVHLVGIDDRRWGPGHVRRKLHRKVETPRVAFLDDDDVWDVNHLRVLQTAAQETGADVVASWGRIQDRGGAPRIPDITWREFFDADALRPENYIAISGVLARTAAVRAAGSFSRHERAEDWALWRRMLDKGCAFFIVPHETWTYRVGDDSHCFQHVPRTWKQQLKYLAWRAGILHAGSALTKLRLL